MAVVITELRPPVAYGTVSGSNRVQWDGMRRSGNLGFKIDMRGRRASIFGVTKAGGDVTANITKAPDIGKVREVEARDLADTAIPVTFTDNGTTLALAALGGGTTLVVFVYHDNPLRPPR